MSAGSILAHGGHSHDGGPGYEWISYAAIALGAIYAMFVIVTKRRR